MPRARRGYLQRVHWLVVWWAEWMDSHIDGSVIGYPSSSPEARAGEGSGGGDGKSKCPEVMMPDGVADVDRAIRVMPGALSSVIVKKYQRSEKVNRHKLDEALTWLSGRLHN